MAGSDSSPRLIPRGSCSWCGHPPHDSKACRLKIRTAVGELRCTCSRKDQAA